MSDRSLWISQSSLQSLNVAPRPFADGEEAIRLGTLYLRIGGSIYASAGSGLIALYWLDLGAVGLFAAVATGFCAYATLLQR